MSKPTLPAPKVAPATDAAAPASLASAQLVEVIRYGDTGAHGAQRRIVPVGSILALRFDADCGIPEQLVFAMPDLGTGATVDVYFGKVSPYWIGTNGVSLALRAHLVRCGDYVVAFARGPACPKTLASRWFCQIHRPHKAGYTQGLSYSTGEARQ